MSDKTLIETLAKLSKTVILKHDKLFKVDGKIMSWEQIVEKLDKILTAHEWDLEH